MAKKGCWAYLETGCLIILLIPIMLIALHYGLDYFGFYERETEFITNPIGIETYKKRYNLPDSIPIPKVVRSLDSKTIIYQYINPYDNIVNSGLRAIFVYKLNTPIQLEHRLPISIDKDSTSYTDLEWAKSVSSITLDSEFPKSIDRGGLALLVYQKTKEAITLNLKRGYYSYQTVHIPCTNIENILVYDEVNNLLYFQQFIYQQIVD